MTFKENESIIRGKLNEGGFMLTDMQMGYLREDLEAVLEEVVMREAQMEIDASCTATISRSEPMRVEFTFVAIFEKKK